MCNKVTNNIKSKINIIIIYDVWYFADKVWGSQHNLIIKIKI